MVFSLFPARSIQPTEPVRYLLGMYLCYVGLVTAPLTSNSLSFIVFSWVKSLSLLICYCCLYPFSSYSPCYIVCLLSLFSIHPSTTSSAAQSIYISETFPQVSIYPYLLTSTSTFTTTAATCRHLLSLFTSSTSIAIPQLSPGPSYPFQPSATLSLSSQRQAVLH